MKKYIFFLGGYDAEMVEIKNILEKRGEQIIDKNLSWGASLSSYKDEIENLPQDKIPVFIELKQDYQYPENALFIDHHDEKAGRDKKTSLEQIAEIFRIELDRRQKLISANDKGHIREMRRLCATAQEIEEIRAYDRKSQGVTEKDEELAQESVEKHLEKIGDNTAVVKSLTDKTSPITDRIYDKFSHIFVYTPDGKMLYSGAGEMVCNLVKIYNEKKQDNPSLQFWYGGDLPDFGYFGTDFPLKEEEIKKMITEKKIISQHIFMFPFRIEKFDFLKVFNTFKESGWIYKPYNPSESGENYSEYFYFHSYIRDALFEKRKEKEILELLKEKQSGVISCYFERCPGKDAKMTIHVKGVKSYNLEINHLSLRIFETGIGIVSIELFNYEHEDMRDVLIINDFGRRLYPQFLAEENNGGIDVPKDKFFAERIEFICKDIKSDECFLFENYCKDDLQIAEYMRKLLWGEESPSYKLIPVIDDRMFTVCWYGSNCRSKKLAEKNQETDEFAYESSDDWYKFIFIDGKSMGCASEKMKKELIKQSTYIRWSEWGTFYGITRYSLMCLSDNQWFSSNILRIHIERMYYQMALLLLAQRASILSFSSRVTHISGDDSFTKSAESKNLEDIKELHSDYIRFVNRLWFTEITPQEQGIEMYSMGLDAMKLKEQTEELKDEIRALYEFAEINYEKIRNRRLGNLNILAFLFMPATLIATVWGVILSFINNSDIPNNSLRSAVIACFAALTFVIGYVLSYQLSKEMEFEKELMKIFQSDTFKIISFFLNVMMLLIFVFIMVKIG